MKLVWCPDTASKAYIEAVRSLSGLGLEDSNVEELIAAMAGGWKAQLIVEAWARDDTAAASIALDAAVRHTRGRRVAVAAEGEVMEEIEGVDFMVVDMRRRDAARVMREARAGPRGMVVVCKNVEKIRNGGIVVGNGMRVVRSVYLPIGTGVEIFHVGVGKGSRLGAAGSGRNWFKHIDRVTGEEHLFRK